MPETVESKPIARDLRFAIVASRFNEEITARLIDGAVDGLALAFARALRGFVEHFGVGELVHRVFPKVGGCYRHVSGR